MVSATREPATTTRARTALFLIDAGCGRDRWVQTAMAAKAAGLSENDFVNWSATAGGKFGGAREAQSVWRSIKANGGVTAATLFALADGGDSGTPPRRVRTRYRSLVPQSSQADATGSLDAVFNGFPNATADHGYITSKRGVPDGLKLVPAGSRLSVAGQDVDGWLAVPARATDGRVSAVQYIPPPGVGQKLNAPGSRFGADSMFVVGHLSPESAIYICEGIGQAWSCVRADASAAAVVTFGSGRMLAVATSLRVRFPAARIVFVSDRGKEAECEQSARSVNAYFVSMPTTASNNYDANDFEAEHGTESLAVLLRGANCPPVRFRLLSSTEISASRPMRWLVKGVLPADGFAAMYGPSRSGKSFLALDLCAAIAGGEAWFGKRVTRAPVTYVCLEGEAGLGKRLTAWRQHHGRELPDGLRWITATVDLRRAIDRTDLAAAMVAQGAVNGLLVIDTLNRAAPGADENSSSDMGDIIESCNELQRAVGGMVLVIHHTGKDGAKGLRGHSSLLASLDAAIEVSRFETQRQWSVAKCKDDADGVSCGFQLHQVDVCQDEWGGVESSCAVVADEALERVTRSVRPRGQNQRAAFEALAEPLAQTTLIGQGSAPPDARCLPLRRALEIVRSRLGGDERHRMERATLAINGLKGRGIYGGDDDWLWTT